MCSRVTHALCFWAGNSCEVRYGQRWTEVDVGQTGPEPQASDNSSLSLRCQLTLGQVRKVTSSLLCLPRNSSWSEEEITGQELEPQRYSDRCPTNSTLPPVCALHSRFLQSVGIPQSSMEFRWILWASHKQTNGEEKHPPRAHSSLRTQLPLSRKDAGLF